MAISQDKKKEIAQLLNKGIEIEAKEKKDAEDKETMDKLQGLLKDELDEIRKADQNPVWEHPESGPASTVDTLQKAVKMPAEKFGSQAENVREFQRLNDALIICKHNGYNIRKFDVYKSLVSGDYPLMKLWYTSGTSNQGEDWVPTEASDDFVRRMEDEYELPQRFEQRRLKLNVGTERILAASSAANVQLISEPTATPTDLSTGMLPGITPNTRYVDISPYKLGGAIWITGEMQEDSAIEDAQIARDELATSMARAQDAIVVNGEDGGATMDDNEGPSSTDPRRAANGLRFLAWDSSYLNTTTSVDWNDTVDLTNWRKTLTKMHKTDSTSGYTRQNFARTGDVIAITGIVGLYKLATIPYLLTKDKVGESATIVLGPDGIPTVMGVPLVYSSQVREDLDNDTPRDSGGSGDSTEVIFANKKAFVVGTKRAPKIEAGRIPTYDGIIAFITGRFAFKELYDMSDVSSGGEEQPAVAVGWNISTTT